MIQIMPQMRILLAVDPVDFRRGIDALARVCKETLGSDPFSGGLLGTLRLLWPFVDFLRPRAEDDKSGFLALAGYSLQTWRELERDLRREVEEGDALLIRTTQLVRCIISKAN